MSYMSKLQHYATAIFRLHVSCKEINDYSLIDVVALINPSSLFWRKVAPGLAVVALVLCTGLYSSTQFLFLTLKLLVCI